MSKEEYANEIKKLAYHYQKGKEDERERILKMINEKIKYVKSDVNLNDYGKVSRIVLYEKLKEELEK